MAEIRQKLIEDQMKENYVDYAMSVITSRALPDVRDGLKPIHRRILFVMGKLGLQHNKPFRKSATVVGNTMSLVHPHGDIAIYDSLVRMAQNFSLRYPLIDGQGNWGSIDGDSAAAMRYTECRLKEIAEKVLEDIDKGTVDFVPNYDGSSEEPILLPSMIPNLLVNGSSGIAVGMATNIPPHNMGEVCDAVIAAIEKPDIDNFGLMNYIKGPDFPTGGIIYGVSGIKSAYLNGKGILKVRARAAIEEKNNRKLIVISEIPYMLNKTLLIEAIADLVKEKKIDGISDIRDESDRKGMRLVIIAKHGSNPDVVLNQLYSQTQLQTTFGITMLALHNGQPSIMNLKRVITYYIQHRKEVVVRRTKFDLDKAEKKAHLLEGLMVALNNIDSIVKLIKSSKDVELAKQGLITNFKLSMEQAQAILEMKLQRLTSLEQQKIKEEHNELLKLIIELRGVLASEEKVSAIVKKELQHIKEKFNDPRRTEIVEGEVEMETEDLIPKENVVVTASKSGYVKKVLLEEYKMQRRGGKGTKAAETKEEDIIGHMFTTNTHSYILIFTNKGKVFSIKAYTIPTASRYSKGKALVNLLQLGEGEKVNAMIPINEFDESHYLIMVTKEGMIKKVAIKAFSHIHKGGIRAIKLDGKDELVQVRLTPGTLKFIIGTAKGFAVRFDEKEVRHTGRNSSGVRGVRLGKGDEVIGIEVSLEIGSLLTVTENGYGKRSKIPDYRLTRRGSKGVINIQTSDRNGDVVGIKTVMEHDEILLITEKGQIIRFLAKDISEIGRNTQGVRLMKLNEGDKVTSITRVIV